MRLTTIAAFGVVAVLQVATYAGSPDRAPGEARLDLYGDPLPQGAIARLGTIRLRHPGHVASVDFSPNGRIVASTSWPGVGIRLWEADTGRLIRSLETTRRNGPRAAVFAPDGRRIAAACGRGTVQVWDAESGKSLWENQNDDSIGQSVVFAPDGRTFAAAGMGNVVGLWETETGKRLLALKIDKNQGEAIPLAFSPDGKLLAYGAEQRIHVYDFARRTEAAVINDAHGGEITSLAYGPGGKTLFSSGATYRRHGARGFITLHAELRAWDAGNGSRISDFFSDESHLGPCIFALSGDRRTIVSEQSNDLSVWRAASGTPIWTIHNYWLPSAVGKKSVASRYFVPSAGIAISPDAAIIACSCQPMNNLLLFETATGRQKPAFPDVHDAQINGIATPRVGSQIAAASQIATGSSDGTVRLWDASTGKQLCTFALSDHFPCQVDSVAFGRDGETLVAAGQDRRELVTAGFIRIWDAKTGAIHREIEAGTKIGRSALSSDGTKLAIEAIKGEEMTTDATGKPIPVERWLMIVETRTGAKRPRIPLRVPLKYLAFDPTGETVHAADQTGVIRTWNAASGQVVREFQTADPAPKQRPAQGRFVFGSRGLFAAVISADGTTAVTSAFGGNAPTIWDIAKGTKIGTLNFTAQRLSPSLVALSANKLRVATAPWSADEISESLSICIWDAKSGQLLKKFVRPSGGDVASLEFATDGKRLISGMFDGTALIWDVAGL
jgi:WD40 repeat protein